MRLKRARTKKYHASINQKKAEVLTLIADNVDFIGKNIIKYKEDYLIMIKGSVQKNMIIYIYIYASNNRASNVIKQKLIELKKTQLQSEISIHLSQ